MKIRIKSQDQPGIFSARNKLAQCVRSFFSDRNGQIAVIFGISSMAIMAAVGSGLDLSNAYLARQKLSQVATLACQYASRPSVIQSSQTSATSYNSSGSSYTTQVNNFITSSLASQNFKLTQTNGSPFTYTQNGAANVTLTSTVPTVFMKIANVQTVPITVTMHCYDTPASVVQRVANGNSSYIVNESFEAGAPAGWSARGADGSYNYPGSAGAYTGQVVYTGATGNKWSLSGYCFEQDNAGVTKATAPDGNNSVELDCSGNSGITTQVYLAAGTYELRWFYTSRILYPNYSPTYICGSAASDVSWATDTTPYSSVANAVKTNQINVYLDFATSSTPPMHTTSDGAVTLAGSNLIDVCVYADNWVERSVKISVTTPGYYFLSFAADGQNDSLGGLLDNVRLCPNTCPGTVQDNFPSAWLVSNKILFEDPFEVMTVKNNYGSWAMVDITTSYGTSGTATSGWTLASSSGWKIDPVNELGNSYYQPVQGTASIELDADANAGGVATSNRTISRPFLLMPGYYQVQYYYRSNAQFASLGSTVYCGATPATAMVTSLTGTGTASTAYSGGGNGTWAKDTNTVGVFMSHTQLASNPNTASWYAQTTFSNPDGTTTSSPKVPNDNISLTSYDSTQVNPLLDICGYASAWQTRTATIKIQKPAYYWLTMAALGTADNVGGSIDDIKLWALGSLYMSSPPSGAVTIPVPAPQPSSTISYTGFSITADPLTP